MSEECTHDCSTCRTGAGIAGRYQDPGRRRALTKGAVCAQNRIYGPKGPGCAVPVLFCRTLEKRLAFYGKLR